MRNNPIVLDHEESLMANVFLAHNNSNIFLQIYLLKKIIINVLELLH